MAKFMISSSKELEIVTNIKVSLKIQEIFLISQSVLCKFKYWFF